MDDGDAGALQQQRSVSVEVRYGGVWEGYGRGWAAALFSVAASISHTMAAGTRHQGGLGSGQGQGLGGNTLHGCDNEDRI